MTASAKLALVATIVGAATFSLSAPAATQAGRSPQIALRWIQMLDTTRGYALSGENADHYRLLWTTDGGHRWADVTPGADTIHPSGPLSILGQTRVFSTKLRQGVYAVERSDDGGRSWRQSLPFRDPNGQGAGQPFMLDARHLFLAVDEGAAAGSQAEALFTSADGGHRWQFVPRAGLNVAAPGSLPFGCDKSGFGFATPKRGWAGGYCAGGGPFFYRTTDGGRTWHRQQLRAPSQCACETEAPRFYTPQVAATSVAGFATNGSGAPFVRVFWTNDGGASWRGSDPPVGRVEDVAFADANDVWIIGQRRGSLRSPFNLLIRTDNRGRNWSRIKLPFDASSYRLDPLSSSVAYGMQIADASNVIITTHDGGRSWQTIHANVG